MSKTLHKLNKEKSPVAAVWFNIAFCFVLGLPYIWSETAYTAIVSVNTIASSISYLIPILCRIILARNTFEPGPFNLGRFSTPVGVIASTWIIVTSALFLCPTAYPVTATNMNYALVPFVLVVGLCVTYFGIWGRHWFKPGGGITPAIMKAEGEKKELDMESSDDNTDLDQDDDLYGSSNEKTHELSHICSHTPPMSPNLSGSEDEIGFPEDKRC